MTYENAYEILSEVRRGINEYSTAYVQGTDTSGAYDNSDILRKINNAQKFLVDILFNREPQLFYKSSVLTPVANILTIPSDFYRIRRLENSDNLQMKEVKLEDKRPVGSYGSEREYYWLAGTIVINADVSTPFTLYYISRPREIHCGMSSAGGALSLTLEAPTAKKLLSYYVGMTIEDITDDWVDTISVYTAARVATLAAQTGAASKYYGLVSELPEVLHPFIGRKATILMRDTYKSLEKPTAVTLSLFQNDLNETLKSYFGTTNTNTPTREIFR